MILPDMEDGGAPVPAPPGHRWERGPDNEAGNTWILIKPNGDRFTFTSRLLEISTMPPDERQRVPFSELVEFGKLFALAFPPTEDDIREILRRQPPPCPEFDGEQFVTSILLSESLHFSDSMLAMSMIHFHQKHRFDSSNCCQMTRMG